MWEEGGAGSDFRAWSVRRLCMHGGDVCMCLYVRVCVCVCARMYVSVRMCDFVYVSMCMCKFV